ncbi:MAG TPA: hypothetical protein VF461_07895 [Gemmatimonadaceae bacterium]
MPRTAVRFADFLPDRLVAERLARDERLLPLRVGDMGVAEEEVDQSDGALQHERRSKLSPQPHLGK